ncbi:MAG: MFS transporter [Alphaproteobacteria bacterium]|nr:MFS transporter [Alphaproteobacteria bacterium]
MPAFVLIASFAVALVFSLMSFMTVAAVLPELKEAWALNNTEAGMVGGAYFIGYVTAVLILTSLTDRIDAKLIYIVSALIGGTATILLGVAADGFWSGVILRILAGLGLAGTYMPGLRALTDQLPEASRNRGVVYYTSFFALGSGLSILVGGEIKEWLDWRWAFIITGAGFYISAAIIAVVLPSNPPQKIDKPDIHPLDFRPVLRNRVALGYVAGIVGSAWEVFALRVWAPTFLIFLIPIAPDGGFWVKPTVMATIIALVGIPASMILGELTAKFDRRRVMIGAGVVSCTASILIAFSIGQSYLILIVLLLVLGAFSYGRNASLVAGMMATADPKLKGLYMAFYASVGFSGGIIAPPLVGAALDLAGGRFSADGWSAGFTALAIGGVITAMGLLILSRPHKH